MVALVCALVAFFTVDLWADFLPLIPVFVLVGVVIGLAIYFVERRRAGSA